MDEKLLQIHDLTKAFKLPSNNLFFKKNSYNKAVNHVSLDVFKGESLGIVGESGCGKSTLARLITQLIRPTSGEVIYSGQDLASLNKKQLRMARKDIQMVFQNPYATLDPKNQILNLLMEPLDIHHVGTRREREQKALEMLVRVGLKPEHAERYPHEFSGGQRQRINIARALMLKPKLIICDEAVSALDVSVQAQVLNLLNELQEEFDLTYIFISHDLNVVRYFCDRIAVMYFGNLIELASANEIYNHPKKDYTKKLLKAIPRESPYETKTGILD
ncbi:ABC transporter ATP-binding protein [Sporolactobacillus terrae]|uniref:Peptide ABC transporter substrate-binding protein n=1 Tax=Sporolactobacillus terrae TaxID=269673 RepID=A0ABX5Q4R2_9BACL|nr:ATP-binding cassette domain-containing protein [Sporolactobacillus terrae]QAA21627.1 peptide ABC transporter substrate-binding protein [Sporolactobacillus terrae]QAA24599.1 peptide ABC transporter substrate-binding protein [Sporolactobacillus terrae]UAK16436.1 ATP-binding cassette domain-containing protein [Sporolactobacillus terrae]